MTAYVYGIFDPDTHKPRYVGMTVDQKNHGPADCLEARFLAHKYRGLVAQWRRKLLNQGKHAYILLLDIVPEALARAAEMTWIELLRAQGEDLFNHDNPVPRNKHICPHCGGDVYCRPR